ncbi:MAG: cation:proton antiporter [Planctomycetaceae bacterium]
MVLTDLVIVFAVAAAVVFAVGRLRVPSVVGLLVAGVLVGPYGLSLVSDLHVVEVLAEIGVVVLLFTVGLEFSLSRLLVMLPTMARVGLPQVAGTTLLVAAATWWYLGTLPQAVFAGMLVAMSSTAIVLKLLADRGETATPHGRVAVAVLLLQDLVVVAAMLAVPLLARAAGLAPPAIEADAGSIGHAPGPFADPLTAVAAGMAVVVAVLVAGRLLVPRILHEVVRLRNRELFLMTIVLACLGTAAVTAQVGLSLALGAFLAGLVLSESEYGHQAFTEVLPFRDTLASLFFVSVGMLLDIGFVVEHAALVAVTVLAIMMGKAAMTALPALLAGYPFRTSLLAGTALAQVGEFSFVLGSRGAEARLLGRDDYQTFLASAVISMAATPLLAAVLPGWLDRLSRTRFCGWMLAESRPTDQPPALSDHVIIAGFGLNGRNLATALAEFGVPHVVLELNPETVRRERSLGLDIHYGDCTRAAVLEHAGIARARTFVLAISDAASTRRSVRVARELAPTVRILVRSEYVAEVDELRQLGADEVIPAEFETALALFDRVLAIYDVPEATVDDLADRMRLESYGFLRSAPRIQHRARHGMQPRACRVPPGSPAIGRSIGELRLRSETGATVVGIRRDGRLVTNPGPDERFAAGDEVTVVGTPDQQAAVRRLFEA